MDETLRAKAWVSYGELSRRGGELYHLADYKGRPKPKEGVEVVAAPPRPSAEPDNKKEKRRGGPPARETRFDENGRALPDQIRMKAEPRYMQQPSRSAQDGLSGSLSHIEAPAKLERKMLHNTFADATKLCQERERAVVRLSAQATEAERKVKEAWRVLKEAEAVMQHKSREAEVQKKALAQDRAEVERLRLALGGRHFANEPRPRSTPSYPPPPRPGSASARVRFAGGSRSAGALPVADVTLESAGDVRET